MKRPVLISCIVALLAVALFWATAVGDSADPLASLSYLQGTFSEQVEEQIEEKLDDSDTVLNGQFSSAGTGGEDTPSVPAAPATTSWQEVRLKEGDSIQASTGTNVLLLAGDAKLALTGGTVVDVTAGQEVADGAGLKSNHRYLAAEDTVAAFIVTSKTAVMDYQGPYAFSYSNAVDYNAMASALKTMHLLKGSFTGFGEGFDLEVAPTRLQALIMFIRVLGEEDEALAWSGPLAFDDITPGTQAERYIGYAKEKGYTNGYTPTEFRGGQAVNAFQYTEFLLRAMGYSSAENTKIGDSLDRAVSAGLLTDNERSMLLHDKFLRAELVYSSYYALQGDLADGGGTLADSLIGKGVFTVAERNDAAELVNGGRL